MQKADARGKELARVHKGRVVNWYRDRGFGFIKPDAGGPDLFCNVTELADGEATIERGDRCAYRIDTNERK